MRTVTFSDANVAALVNGSFVAVWRSRVPRFRDAELGTELYIATHKGEIFATRNIATYFLDSNGRLLHAMRGYYNPARFLEELRFALDVFGDTRDERTARASYVRLHQARSKARAQEAGALARSHGKPPAGFHRELEELAAKFEARNGAGKPPPKGDLTSRDDCGYFGVTLVESGWSRDESPTGIWNTRRGYTVRGLGHLAKASGSLSAWAQRRGALPPLEKFDKVLDATVDTFAEE